MQLPLRTILLLAVVAFVAVRGCESSRPEPVGPDAGDVAAIAEQAMEAYGRLCADEFAASAADPAETSTGHGERLLERTEAARKAAFQPLADAAEKALGGDRYTPEKAAAFDRAVAEGYRRASR